MDDIKFVLFSIGLGTAISSSIISIYLLYTSLLGKPSVVYESNHFLAIIEIILLILAIGTCVTAAEIYYKYLKSPR